MEVTNIDLRPLTLGDFTAADALLTAGGAGTIKKGTILSRSIANVAKSAVFDIGGSTDGNGIPSAVLLHDVVATGAGDYACRVLVAGKVSADLLVVDEDGDASNLTNAEFDLLRDYSIVVVPVTDSSVLDNQ